MKPMTKMFKSLSALIMAHCQGKEIKRYSRIKKSEKITLGCGSIISVTRYHIEPFSVTTVPKEVMCSTSVPKEKRAYFAIVKRTEHFDIEVYTAWVKSNGGVVADIPIDTIPSSVYDDLIAGKEDIAHDWLLYLETALEDTTEEYIDLVDTLPYKSVMKALKNNT